MKLVFTADLHIGSAFSGENADIRNAELVENFRGIVKYAEDNGASFIILGGDLFDTPYPAPELEGAVYGIIAGSSVRFIAISGNHDPLSKTRFYKNPPENMTVLPAHVTGVDLGGVMLYGASVYNADDTADIWQNFCTEGEFITLSHGELSGNGFIPLSRTALSQVGARLNLLGHIHLSSVTVLSNGRHAIYCGCPAGRGFDECGEKGFYVIDTDGYTYDFIKCDGRQYKEYTVDLTDLTHADIVEKLCSITPSANEISRAVLTGSILPELEIDITRLLPLTQFIEIKDKTEVGFDKLEIAKANTLEGEFVRILLADDSEFANDAIAEGIKALRRQK